MSWPPCVTGHGSGAGRRWAVRSSAVGAMVAVLALAAGCGGDEPASLPDCASDLPLGEGIEVAATIASPDADNPTCAVALSSALDVDGVVDALATAFTERGIAHSVPQQAPDRAAMQLEGPVCGSVLVFAAGTERVTDAVPADRTPVLVSLLDCAVAGSAPPPG